MRVFDVPIVNPSDPTGLAPLTDIQRSLDPLTGLAQVNNLDIPVLDRIMQGVLIQVVLEVLQHGAKDLEPPAVFPAEVGDHPWVVTTSTLMGSNCHHENGMLRHLSPPLRN